MSPLTKIFIFMQTFFSLVTAVFLVALLGHQENYKSEVDSARSQLFAAQASLAKATNETAAVRQQKDTAAADALKTNNTQAMEIDRLKTQIAQGEAALNAAEAKNAAQGASIQQLTAVVDASTKQLQAKDQENGRLAPENVKLIQQNAELSRANNEAVTKLQFAEQAIRKLQEQVQMLTENAGKGGAAVQPSEAGTVASLAVQTPAVINGKISDVRPTVGRTLIELPLGTRDGVRKDTRFMIYRGNAYVADAVVVGNPEPDKSVAAVDAASVKAGETVQKGDMVMSGNSH